MRSEAEAPVTGSRDEQQAGVECEAVDKAHGDVQALRGVTLRVAAGEIVALVGPSGCGKSTLLELVCGLQAPDAGRIHAGPAALMPQRDALLPWLSALDNAGLALRVAGVPRARARELAHAHFAAFGLEGFEAARPAALSGGMRQRVAFLRTLLAGPPRPLPGRAVRRARRAHPAADAALARGRAGARAAHGPARHARRRGGGPARRPRGAALAAPGPGGRALDVEIARPRERDDPALVALRERALEVLGAA